MYLIAHFCWKSCLRFLVRLQVKPETRDCEILLRICFWDTKNAFYSFCPVILRIISFLTWLDSWFPCLTVILCFGCHCNLSLFALGSVLVAVRPLPLASVCCPWMTGCAGTRNICHIKIVAVDNCQWFDDRRRIHEFNWRTTGERAKKKNKNKTKNATEVLWNEIPKGRKTKLIAELACQSCEIVALGRFRQNKS